MSNTHSSTYTANKTLWLLWLPAAFFYCYQLILRISPSVMTQDLMRDFSISAGDLGALSSAWYLSYAAMQIPLGTLIDYFGPRRLLTISTLLCVLGTVLFASSETLAFARIGRFLIGAGCACGFIGSIKVGTLWFEQRKWPLITGFTILLGAIGGISGSAPLRLLINAFGWRMSLYFVAALGIILAFCIWIFVKDKVPTVLKEKNHHTFLEGLRVALKNRTVWLCGAYSFCAYTALSVLVDLWATPYLARLYDLSTTQAASYVSLTFVGLACGSLFFSSLAHKFDEMYRIFRFVTFGIFCSVSILIFVPNLPLFVAVICFISLGFFFGGESFSFPIACGHVPSWASGTTVGFVNAICMSSGRILQPFVGKLLDYSWDGTKIDGAPVFSIDHYRLSLSVIPICIGIAFLISFFIKDAQKAN